MNEPFASCTIAIILVTSFCSWIGFRDVAFREKYLFSVREILVEKQYRRLFSSALLHADWNHLVLNMVSIYLFGRHIEMLLGIGPFLLVYFSAVVGGDLLSLWIHRNHEYRAYGASGGACGLVFSYIFLFPGSDMVVFPVPVGIPAWLYAILFLVGSFLSLRRSADNIGHDAHLGGAIIGLWTTVALRPEIIRIQPKLFIAVTVLAGLLFFYLIKNPLFLPISSFFPLGRGKVPKNREKSRATGEGLELDAILEKISQSGMESLSPEERTLLNSASEKYRRQAESKKPKSDLII